MTTSLQGLIWSVQALAQAAEIQITVFPSFVACADEMALSFEEFYGPAILEFRERLNAQQLLTLQLLDQKLTEISGPDNDAIWLDEDCLSHPEWSIIRNLAKDILVAFGLSFDAPPASDAIYVEGMRHEE